MTIRRLAAVSWASLIILFYYRRAWRLLAAGPAGWDVHGFFVGGWRPPWPGAAAAAWRAGAGIGGALAVCAAAWFLGEWMLRLLRSRPDHPADAALFRLAAGLAALSYLSLALAALGWYRPHVVAPVVVLLAAVGAVRIAAECRARCRAALQGRRLARVSRPVPLAIVISIALAIALVGALAPEKEYDALWYHLWLPRLWLQAGHPVDVLAEYVALYPLGWELLYGDAMSLGGIVAAKLLHFACLPLLAAATWRTTRQFFPRVSPVLAAAILVTTPTVLWEATTAYGDLALGLYVTLGAQALLAHARERDSEARAGWFRLAVLCLGFAATIKHLGLLIVALSCTALAARAAIVRLAGPAAHRTDRNARAAAAGYLSNAVVLGLSAVVFAFAWYWRAWSASGNPVFPELFWLFGARPPQRWDAMAEAGLAAFKAHFGFGRSLQSLLRLPWDLTQHGAAFGGCLGPMFLVAVPGVVAALYRCSRQPSGWRSRIADQQVGAYASTTLVFLVVGYVAMWASPVSSFQLRFLVPIVPLMSVLAALGLDRLLPRGRQRVVESWLVAGVLALNLPLFTSLHDGDRHGWSGWLTHVVRGMPLGVVVGREPEEAFLRREVATYGAWQRLALDTASDPAVLVLEVGGGDNVYATRPKIPADSTLARGAWAEGAAGPEVVRRTLARLGITHVLFERTELARMTREGAALASPSLRQAELVLEYEDSQALLYRVARTSSSATQRSLRPN